MIAKRLSRISKSSYGARQKPHYVRRLNDPIGSGVLYIPPAPLPAPRPAAQAGPLLSAVQEGTAKLGRRRLKCLPRRYSLRLRQGPHWQGRRMLACAGRLACRYPACRYSAGRFARGAGVPASSVARGAARSARAVPILSTACLSAARAVTARVVKARAVTARTEAPRKNYFKEYAERDATPMGHALTKLRCGIVTSYASSHKDGVDMGIGGGAFVSAMGCLGYDVEPDAVQWLKQNGRWYGEISRTSGKEVYRSVEWMTFWDSFEHMTEEEHLLWLPKAKKYVFMSIPIFSLRKICTRYEWGIRMWKHYKPGEHLWYFTYFGLIKYMRWHGFEYRKIGMPEVKLGREDIWTFVFERERSSPARGAPKCQAR